MILAENEFKRKTIRSKKRGVRGFKVRGYLVPTTRLVALINKDRMRTLDRPDSRPNLGTRHPRFGQLTVTVAAERAAVRNTAAHRVTDAGGDEAGKRTGRWEIGGEAEFLEEIRFACPFFLLMFPLLLLAFDLLLGQGRGRPTRYSIDFLSFPPPTFQSNRGRKRRDFNNSRREKVFSKLLQPKKKRMKIKADVKKKEEEGDFIKHLVSYLPSQRPFLFPGEV